MKVKSCEERAITLLEKLKRPKEKKSPERPYFIEITGPPSSGKTTIIQILDPFFRRQGFRVYTPQEGAEVIRHIPRTSHLYNVRTGLYALTTLIDASVNNNYDLVIFDRCLFDACTWPEYWIGKNDLSRQDADTIQCFFALSGMKLLDAVFFVTADIKTVLKREKTVSLTEKFGETTNPKSLEQLINLFSKVYEKYYSELPHVFLIDTSKMDRKQMTEIVLEKTLNALEKRLGGKK